jgi:hypothetical protein
VLGGCYHHSVQAVVTRDAYNIHLLHRDFLNLIINCAVLKKWGPPADDVIIIIKIIVITSVRLGHAMNPKIALFCPSFF